MSHDLGLGVGHKDSWGSRKDYQWGNFSGAIGYSGAQAHLIECSIRCSHLESHTIMPLACERLIEGIPIEIKTSKSKTIAKGNSEKEIKPI